MEKWNHNILPIGPRIGIEGLGHSIRPVLRPYPSFSHQSRGLRRPMIPVWSGRAYACYEIPLDGRSSFARRDVACGEAASPLTKQHERLVCSVRTAPDSFPIFLTTRCY